MQTNNNTTQTGDLVPENFVTLPGDLPSDLTIEGSQDWIKEQNIATILAAANDLNIRNHAKMALIHDQYNVEISALELLNLKLEVLVDHIWKDDQLKRAEINFDFQKRIADHLQHIESHIID